MAQIHLKGWQKDYQGLISQDYLNSLTFENRLQRRREILVAENTAIHLVAL